MRINTDGNQAYREDLYERVAEKLGESTKTGGIDAACIHAEQDVQNKKDVMDFLAGELPPDQLAHVAELLSTEQVPVTVETSVEIKAP